MIVLLGLATAATVAALLFPAVARWAWMTAALLTAAWATVVAGVPGGLPMVVGVAAATVLEPAVRPATTGFNDLVARLGAVVIGSAVAVLVVIRVLQADVGGDLPVFLLVLMGVATAAYLLAQQAPAEQARAVRLAIVLALAGWAATGHLGFLPGVGAAVLVVGAAITARRRVPA